MLPDWFLPLDSTPRDQEPAVTIPMLETGGEALEKPSKAWEGLTVLIDQ